MTQKEADEIPRRVIPALPDEDPLMGRVAWDRWKKAPILTHIPGDCDTCGFEGPLRIAAGRTYAKPRPVHARVARSTQTQDGRSRWQMRISKPRWLYTHWAVRCPACDEMSVWRKFGPDGKKDWTRILYHPHMDSKTTPLAGDDC